MHEVNLAGETRQKQRLLRRAVATADDGDVHLAIKRTVARRAGRHALAAVKFLFARDARHARRGAGRDDHALRENRAIAADQLPRVRGEVDGGDERLLETRAELCRLLAEILHQLIAVDSLGEPREILHLARRRELAAGQRAFEHERIQVGASGVDRRGQACAARADDDDVFDGGRHEAVSSVAT